MKIMFIKSGIKEVVEEKLEAFERKIENKEFSNFTDLVIEFKNIKVDLEVINILLKRKLNIFV